MTQDASPSLDRHMDLPAGTVLTLGKMRIKVLDMKGDFGHVEHVRKDGAPDRRYGRWSGCVGRDWTIVAPT